MHLKRQNAEKFWPVPRKGTKYLAVPSHEKKSSITLIMAVRDILRFAKDKREVKEMLKAKQITVNGKIVSELNYAIALFDTLAFPSPKKFFKATLKESHITLEEINEKEANLRIYKVIGKKQQGGKKQQINLSGGKNILSAEKVNTGEFVIIDADNKISRVLTMQKGSHVMAVTGKNLGANGKIKGINEESGEKIAEIEADKGVIKINIKNLFITG